MLLVHCFIVQLYLYVAYYHSKVLRADMFGLDGTVKNWLRSYLTGRRSYVACGQHHSSSVTTSTGVPQGSSVLGPLLFTMHYSSWTSHLITQHVISSVRQRCSIVYLYWSHFILWHIFTVQLCKCCYPMAPGEWTSLKSDKDWSSCFWYPATTG